MWRHIYMPCLTQQFFQTFMDYRESGKRGQCERGDMVRNVSFIPISALAMLLPTHGSSTMVTHTQLTHAVTNHLDTAFHDQQTGTGMLFGQRNPLTWPCLTSSFGVTSRVSRFKTFTAAWCNKIFPGCQPRQFTLSELTQLTAREDFITTTDISDEFRALYQKIWYNSCLKVW
jgi:hypothetical protein